MSYCRFGEADIYAYESTDGWEIHVSERGGLPHDGGYFNEPTLEAFEARMLMLRDLGYCIPDDVFEEIAEEKAEKVTP